MDLARFELEVDAVVRADARKLLDDPAKSDQRLLRRGRLALLRPGLSLGQEPP
jgi:hypothetical protein